jgi:CBS domain-containing protein
MFKRSNSVDLFTNKVMDFMTDDYVLVDKEQTVKSSIEKLRTEKNQPLL